MIPDQKLKDTLAKLLVKTKAGEATWDEVDTPGGVGYGLKLPRSAIMMRRYSPQSDPDFIRITFYNAEGRAAVEFTTEFDDPDWAFLDELFSTVHRKLMRWDEVMGDLESFVRGR